MQISYEDYDLRLRLEPVWYQNIKGMLRGVSFTDEMKMACLREFEAFYSSALSAQVQDVAGLERLRDVTYAVQHNPNCPAKYLVRLVGKSGRIDLKPYGNHLPMVKHETGDVLGFGKTLDDAIDKALSAAAPAKQEGGTNE